MQEKNKILFIIPAYNEEKNISKVINEISDDVDYADVIVVDDSSSDNTKNIVYKSKTKCISTIFNLRYAWAVQTGIKYASQNNYDYAMLFDADGQHIAKEARTLIEYALNNKQYDIIIGSRYLKDMGYPCPIFRKIGTKIFSGMVKLFCGQKIADPLSGFQCLNRRVIEKFSKMGSYPEYPDANLIIDMLLKGYRIKEIPVKMRLREEGESMHGGIIKPIKYMINMFYAILIIVIQNIGKSKEVPNE